MDFSDLAFSGSAQFSSHLHKITQNSSLQVSSFQTGGADTGAKVGITLEEVINKAASFPHEVLTAGVPVQAFIQDYSTLAFPNSPNPIDLNRHTVLKQFYRLRNDLVNKLNNIIYITQEHPEEFENIESFHLPEAQQKIQGWLDTITQSASNCANIIHDCSNTTPTLEIINLPPRKKTPSDGFIKRPDLESKCVKHQGGQDPIYVIIDGVLRWVPNPDIMNRLFNNWDVEIVDCSGIEGFNNMDPQ